ncbi:MAG: sugar phosphate isomerase/epimerase [Gemmatimonadota bacterium]|nr:sugar phosphate isomerase/epimerase [Gemmatimonadota bacterium]
MVTTVGQKAPNAMRLRGWIGVCAREQAGDPLRSARWYYYLQAEPRERMTATTEPYDPGTVMGRRDFLAKAGAGVAALALGSNAARGGTAASRISHVGVQLYTIREAMDRDFDGSLARVAAIGYREVELAGYHGRTPAEFRAVLDRYQLVAPSTHIPMERVRDDLNRVLDEAHVLGHRFVICPNIADEKSGLDGYRRAAEVLNHAGEIAKRNGVTIGYHNHGTELHAIDGVRPYDVILDRTDPKFVVMEMDIYWLVTGGGDPLSYFAKYPGRFRMVHVKDMAGDASHTMVDVGRGVIDWKSIFARSREAGIEHYFVEHDEAKDPFASIAAGYGYLNKLRF